MSTENPITIPKEKIQTLANTAHQIVLNTYSRPGIGIPDIFAHTPDSGIFEKGDHVNYSNHVVRHITHNGTQYITIATANSDKTHPSIKSVAFRILKMTQEEFNAYAFSQTDQPVDIAANALSVLRKKIKTNGATANVLQEMYWEKDVNGDWKFNHSSLNSNPNLFDEYDSQINGVFSSISNQSFKLLQHMEDTQVVNNRPT